MRTDPGAWDLVTYGNPDMPEPATARPDQETTTATVSPQPPHTDGDTLGVSSGPCATTKFMVEAVNGIIDDLD
jgi:hypothetical protein